MTDPEPKVKAPETAESTQPEDQAQETRTSAAPDYYDQLLRLKAEFENYRKRVDREKPDYFRRGRAEVLLKLLPVYDLLQKAHEEIQASHAETPFAKGMEGIFKELDKLFKEEGVKAMEPLGKLYDPLAHEVLGTVDSDDAEDGVVVEVLQNGFNLQDKVLRTAKVRIARKK